ncbi:uncharacterized protein V6R79_022134 [Siganus canaliculatus]
MSTRPGIDYSSWDHIYVSDDEDVTSPFVDTASLYRMRHRVRLEKRVELEQRGDDLKSNAEECRRLLKEAEGRLEELQGERRKGETGEGGEEALKSLEAEVKKLKLDKKNFEKLMDEHERDAKKLPWNVDTISREGFSKSVVNIRPQEDETEKEKLEKHKTFVEKHIEEIRHFGMLRRWDDSQRFLADHPHLVCKETASCLVVLCLDLEVEEKHALMEQVAHQAIVMQCIMDLAQTLKLDPRGCFRLFFSKMQTAEKQHQDEFHRELEALKERVRRCSQARLQGAMKELEEEERMKRLGPGGLDPVEVYDSLPQDIQRSFDEKNLQLLQEAMDKLDPEEGRYHLMRCIQSGLWVPEEEEGEEEEEEEEDTET